METLDLSTSQYIIIFTATYLAEVYGSIVGGGGFLIQSTLIIFGNVPPHMAVALDVTATTGTNIGGYAVFKNKNLIRWKIVTSMLPGLIVGTILGLYFLNNVSAQFIKIFLAITAILLVIYSLFFKKETGLVEQAFNEKRTIIFFISGLLLGCHGSFSGAGSGTISTIVLVGIFGTTFLQAVAVEKVLFIIPLILSAIGYIYLNLIHWPLLIVMFFACFLGGLTGGKLSILIGNKYLKPIFITAVLFFAVYLLFFA